MEKKTALYDRHLAYDTKMVPYAGYAMPLRYAGDNLEHMGVRRQVGIFDVSHMGEFLLRGPYALELLQRLTTNDVSKIEVGKAQYNCMTTHTGGIVDDLIVYRLEEELYMMVVNAANIEKDWFWVRANNIMGADLENISDHTSLIAISGPLAPKLMKKLTDIDVENIPFYAHETGKVAGKDRVMVATTGYTGERTFELYVRNEDATAIWDAAMDEGEVFGIQPCGLGARDTLRLEMGYLLYGNDIHEETLPVEASLNWITKTDKDVDFNGKDKIMEAKARGLRWKLIAFETTDRGIPRRGHKMKIGDEEVGVVTSGVFSPSLRNGIGLGYIHKEHSKRGTEFSLEIRGKAIGAEIKKLPLVKNTSLQVWLNKN